MFSEASKRFRQLILTRNIPRYLANTCLSYWSRIMRKLRLVLQIEANSMRAERKLKYAHDAWQVLSDNVYQSEFQFSATPGSFRLSIVGKRRARQHHRNTKRFSRLASQAPPFERQSIIHEHRRRISTKGASLIKCLSDVPINYRKIESKRNHAFLA